MLAGPAKPVPRGSELSPIGAWPVALHPKPHYDHAMAKPVTDPFVLHACELLSCLGPCVAKRMFGGWGISLDSMNIGLIAWDTLFLKTNVDTAPQWLAAGGRPFQYEAKGKTMRLHYHTPPDEALESPSLMLPWARLALTAAVAARKPVRRRSRTSKTA